MRQALLSFLAISSITLQSVNGLYFYLSKGQERCFKDEVLAESMLYIRVHVWNEEAERFIAEDGDAGVRLRIFNKAGEEEDDKLVTSDEMVEHYAVESK